MDLSIVIPVKNEAENIEPLHKELSQTLTKLGSYEIIFVNDGSTDRSLEVLRRLQKRDSHVVVIQFRKNFGQTAAMDAGFKQAQGDIIIPMDADLQNDPKDIPKLLNKLREGFDVVSGWRKNRQDSAGKSISSRLAHLLRQLLIKEEIHDSGCTLKAYKKECFKDLNLYGEMHRYIPAILRLKGFKIGEVIVNHRPRKSGKTKYGTTRIVKGFFDLLFIKFWNDFSVRPIHFFGSLGLFQYFLAALIFLEQVWKAVYVVGSLELGPLMVLSVLLIITGTLTIMFGFLAEIMIREYYKDRVPYSIETVYK
ncbi:MAG TPA: glycosyltransferase family 2 protein [Candidatus Nanoarchaeia archaeon]|nr:glycosyltransferase family 2 protein [Candidatus Nanoarchaeia archaeon]